MTYPALDLSGKTCPPSPSVSYTSRPFSLSSNPYIDCPLCGFGSSGPLCQSSFCPGLTRLFPVFHSSDSYLIPRSTQSSLDPLKVSEVLSGRRPPPPQDSLDLKTRQPEKETQRENRSNDRVRIEDHRLHTSRDFTPRWR